MLIVAGTGFEPATLGLWAPRANQLLYPAMINPCLEDPA